MDAIEHLYRMMEMSLVDADRERFVRRRIHTLSTQALDYAADPESSVVLWLAEAARTELLERAIGLEVS